MHAAKAAKMAAKSVDLMTEKLIDVRQVGNTLVGSLVCVYARTRTRLHQLSNTGHIKGFRANRAAEVCRFNGKGAVHYDV